MKAIMGRGFWNRLQVSLLLALLGALVLSLPVSAQEPAAVLGAGDMAIKGPVSVEFVFDESGAWMASATLEGVQLKQMGATIELDKLELKDQSPESLKEMLAQLGMALDIPEMDPNLIAFVMNKGIGLLAVREMSSEDYYQLDAYVNNQLLMTVQASPGVVGTAMGQLGMVDPATGEMVTSLLDMGELRLALRFPGGDDPTSFADVLDTVAGAPANKITVGATLSRMPTRTNIVSLAGVTVEEINGLLNAMSPGLMMPNLATTFLSDFNIEQIDAALGANGLEVMDSSGRWVKVLCDEDSREAVYGLLPVLGDLFGVVLQLDAATQSIIEQALATTELDVTVYDASEAQEGLPELSVGKPFMVEISDEGILSVNGLPLGMMDARVVAALEPSLLGAIQYLSSWDMIDAGALEALAQLVLG